nr:hypothetical protein GZ27E7_6 [uncultured archaeon GZfos27E7]
MASAPIRVNSTGGILTLWLIKLRGTRPHPHKCPGPKSEGIRSLPSSTRLFQAPRLRQVRHSDELLPII